MRKNNKNKGFTLVELLIVVAIIGILAAVLTPQFLNARKVAADKAAEAFAHNIYTAVQAVIAESGEFKDDAEGNQLSCVSTTTEGVTTDHEALVIGGYTIQIPGSGLKVTECTIEAGYVEVKYEGGTDGKGPVKIGTPAPTTGG